MPNITVYMPDALQERMKAQPTDRLLEMNISGIFQRALTDELDRLERLEQARDGMAEHEFDVEDKDGTPVRLRFIGKFITGSDPAVYLTEHGAVLVAFDDGYATFDDVDAFADWVAEPHRDNLGRNAEESLSDALGSLGARRVVEIP